MYKWIALASGFALMAFELVAARLLAPTIGSSTFIWTNVIGVIMGALAIGYWWGGKLADKRKREADVVCLCLAAATLVVLVLIFHGGVIEFACGMSADARWQGLFAALFLFAPTSVVVGMLSPYLAKLALKSTTETGETVARLSTFNAIGSIAGTFITGFFLFGAIGSRATLVVVVGIMLVASWLIKPMARVWQRVTACAILLLGVLFAVMGGSGEGISVDTATANYRITQRYTASGRSANLLWAGPNGIQSAAYLSGSKDLIFWYTQEIANVVGHLSDEGGSPERILIIGGGAFSLPEYFGRFYPEAKIDVVEIDPDLEGIAEEYFRFEKPENVTVYAEDARSYVNRVNDVFYDYVVVDVFSDADVPWQFVTREFGEKVASLLADDGVVVVNSIFGLVDGCDGFSEALLATYGSELPYVYMKSESPASTSRDNHMLVFGNRELSMCAGYSFVDTAGFRAYSDDFAPIEHLWQECVGATTG